MKILWFTWKDLDNPLAGGAEIVNENLARRLVQDGHEVIFIVAGFHGAQSEQSRNGFKIIRIGNRWSVYFKAWRLYKRRLQGWADVIIDECNTLPFFCRFYAKEPSILLIQQLAREIWFYQMPFPLSLFGYLAEPLYLRLINKYDAITFTASTKDDLTRLGFKESKTHIIPEAFDTKQGSSLPAKKNPKPSLLFLSSLRPMKRPHHVIRAFEIAKKEIPALTLHVAGHGSGSYFKYVERLMSTSPFAADIVYWGSVDEPTKHMLMSQCHFICSPSVREGWGLIVTEAGVLGTPAIVYDIPGLREAVDLGNAGLLCSSNTPHGMARQIVRGFKTYDYSCVQQKALVWCESSVSIDASCRALLTVSSNVIR